MEEKEKRRTRGQVIPLGSQPGYTGEKQDFGIRVPLKERGTNGRNKSHYETIHNVTLFQATKHLNSLLAKVDAGGFFTAKKITVEDFCKEWLAQKERDRLKLQTVYHYTDIVRYFITPHVGKLLLGEMKGSTVRDFYNALQDRKLAHGTLMQVARITRQIFRDAKTWGYIKDNPSEGVKPPAGGHGKEAYVFDTEQALKFIQVCAENPRDLIFVLYLATGVRPRELTGLTWPHVKLMRQESAAGQVERGVIEIRQIAFKERGTEGRWLLTSPKTKKSVRDVPFPAVLYHALVAYRQQLSRQKALMGREWNKLDLVFPSPKGTPLGHNNLRNVRFKTLLKRAKLPTHFTLYSFRYSFATLQLLAGERDKVVAELMGHTKPNFTAAVYQKVLPEMRERASDRLEKLLFEDSCTILAQPVSEREM